MAAREAMLREAKEQRRREFEEWRAQRDVAREIKYASRGGVQPAGKENTRPASPTSASTSACQAGRPARHATSKGIGNPVSIASSTAKPLAEICKNNSTALCPSAARNCLHHVHANTSTKCYGSLSASTILMLELWEDRAWVPPAPPTSPVKPWLFDCPSPSLYISMLNEALAASFAQLECTDEASTENDDTGPSEDKTPKSRDACPSKLRQSLFERLEAVAIEEPTSSPQTLPSSKAHVPSCTEESVWNDGHEDEAHHDVERLRLVVERLAASGEASAAPELGRLRQQLCKYVWPWADAKSDCDAQSVLNDEDILSRAFDITIFHFFDARLLTRQRLVEMGQFPDSSEKLAPICEYPPGWSQWKIDSFELREAVQAGRRRSSDGLGAGSRRSPVRAATK